MTDQRGFTLIELVIALAVVSAAGAAAVAALASVSRAATPNVMRDGAMMAAENALARARAAAAYVAVGDGPAPSDPATAGLLRRRTTTFNAGVRVPSAAACAGAPAGTDPAAATMTLPVTTTYAAGVITVTVTYPRDRCTIAAGGAIPANDAATIVLHETLAPPLYLPGHTITRAVADPARM